MRAKIREFLEWLLAFVILVAVLFAVSILIVIG